MFSLSLDGSKSLGFADRKVSNFSSSDILYCTSMDPILNIYGSDIAYSWHIVTILQGRNKLVSFIPRIAENIVACRQIYSLHARTFIILKKTRMVE